MRPMNIITRLFNIFKIENLKEYVLSLTDEDADLDLNEDFFEIYYDFLDENPYTEFLNRDYTPKEIQKMTDFLRSINAEYEASLDRGDEFSIEDIINECVKELLYQNNDLCKGWLIERRN